MRVFLLLNKIISLKILGLRGLEKLLRCNGLFQKKKKETKKIEFKDKIIFLNYFILLYDMNEWKYKCDLISIRITFYFILFFIKVIHGNNGEVIQTWDNGGKE